VGTILETPEFYPFLTPEETLSYLGRLRGMRERGLRGRIREVLKLVRLDTWTRVKIGKFSRGMKQRLALAQAMLHDPPILVLDEPSLGLDPRGMMEVRQILKEASKRKTVFFASHLLTEVAQVCKKVAIIDHGKLRAYDDIGRLKKKYRSFERAYLKLTEARI
jgi:ABC-2 type transport system ATP-binding protein